MARRDRIRAATSFVLATSVLIVGCSTRGAAGTTEAPRPTTSSADVNNASGKSTAEMLEGRFPGVNVIRVAGGGIKVRVRQSGDFDGRGDPLYIIEPNEIARIEVLKDAASTSIYGLRGANGVVKITMKR